MSITPESKSIPTEREDILTETVEDVYQGIHEMDETARSMKLHSPDMYTTREIDYELLCDTLHLNLETAKVGEMHAANLIAIATSQGDAFTADEKRVAAEDARILMGMTGH